MRKKKLAAIIAPCVIAIIVVTVITTLSPENTGEPEQIAVSAYNLSEQLFDPQLTSLQRDILWKEYEGKQVKWTSELENLVLEQEEPIAHFLNPLDWERTEVRAVFDESQASSLLQCKEGDLVTYTGTLASFGEAEIDLTNCTVVSLAIVPLWWNDDIDTSQKRILVGDEVLCLGPTTCGDAAAYLRPKITAVSRGTGDLLWEDKKPESVLVGIDSHYIYTFCLERVETSSLMYHEGWGNIAALDKVSGQIGWTSDFYDSFFCLYCVKEGLEVYECSRSECVDTWVLNRSVREEITNMGEPSLIFLMDKPLLSELTYEYQGVTYESDSNSYGGAFGVGHCGLRAVEKETADVLWIATFGYAGMTDFSVTDGTLYVSTDNGVGAFELPNLTDS